MTYIDATDELLTDWCGPVEVLTPAGWFPACYWRGQALVDPAGWPDGEPDGSTLRVRLDLGRPEAQARVNALRADRDAIDSARYASGGLRVEVAGG